MEQSQQILSLNERVANLSTNNLSLKEYIGLLGEQGEFIIPDYQRGYVWGQWRKDYPTDSVSNLVNTIKKAFDSEEHTHGKYIFLQGITAHDNPGTYNISIVDGQQRTTFFYLLLKYLGYEGHLKIKYLIRKESNEFLSKININDSFPNEEEEFQDIYFIKKTIAIFNKEFEAYQKERLLEYILNNVKFLFVTIPANQANSIFTMMNGNKAKMKDEELIKSELLRCSSLKDDRIYEAEQISIRGRLAREWDQWLHWWNQDEVKDFFKTDEMQIGWLLPLVLKKHNVTFADFCERKLKDQSITQAKKTFKELRLIQKNIEDAYNSSKSYNFIGFIMYMSRDSEQRFSFLRWYFNIDKDINHPKQNEELERYYNWMIIGVNHEDIVANNISSYNDKRNSFLDELDDNQLYRKSYEVAFRWLVKQNIQQDNVFLGRRFDFSIEKERSLEHIYPKSKIAHYGSGGKLLDWKDEEISENNAAKIKLMREEIKATDSDGKETTGSEHCIGNLVLLYKTDNSQFNDSDFSRKNHHFFVDKEHESFKSRHLIHSTMVFSDARWNENDGWSKTQIACRKKEELDEFNKQYPIIEE